MPVHHLLICDSNANTIIERFYLTPEERKKEINSNDNSSRGRYMKHWNQRVISLTRPTWSDAYRGIYQVATVGNKFIVYISSGKLLFIITMCARIDMMGFHIDKTVVMNVIYM